MCYFFHNQLTPPLYLLFSFSHALERLIVTVSTLWKRWNSSRTGILEQSQIRCGEVILMAHYAGSGKELPGFISQLFHDPEYWSGSGD